MTCSDDSAPADDKSLELESDSGTLSIFEYNDFRHLLHLELALKKATHEEARKWLSKKLLL
jgi:hypothetical protein